MERKRVLVYDQDPNILRVLELILTDYGWETITCHDVDNLEKQANNFNPDVIIIDSGVHAAEGTAVIKKLKTDFFLKSTPVVIMSTDNEIRVRAKGSGAEFFLPKPFDLDDLERILKTAHYRYQMLEDELQPALF